MVEEDGTIQGMDLDTKSYTDKLDISVSGTTPTGGYLNYENNVLKDGCLTMGEYKVTIENGEVTTTEKGACESVSLTACDSSNFNPSPEEWFNFDSSTGTITGFSESWDGTTDITIPCKIGGVDVVNIGDGAFAYQTLTSVVISDTVEMINQAAFISNSNLTKLLLGKNVKTIGRVSFNSCNLNELKIPDSVETIGDISFGGNKNLSKLIIGENVKSIGESAFMGCNLNELEIPDNVELIAPAAFHNNKNLSSISLGNNLKTISTAAFLYCNLTEVVIPSNVETIGVNAFGKSLNFGMGPSNLNLTTIYNNTGKKFDWYSIINSTSSTEFETESVINEAGNVLITKSN